MWGCTSRICHPRTAVQLIPATRSSRAVSSLAAAALYGEITLNNGRVEQRSRVDYSVHRLPERKPDHNAS